MPKLSTKRSRGRPTKHTKRRAAEICQRRAAGESLRAICRDEAMPSETSVRRWALADTGGFSSQYAQAVEIDSAREFDELMRIADEASPEDVQVQKLRIDTRKWVLAKRLPKHYGDKQEIEHTGAGYDEIIRLLGERGSPS